MHTVVVRPVVAAVMLLATAASSSGPGVPVIAHRLARWPGGLVSRPVHTGRVGMAGRNPHRRVLGRAQRRRRAGGINRGRCDGRRVNPTDRGDHPTHRGDHPSDAAPSRGHLNHGDLRRRTRARLRRVPVRSADAGRAGRRVRRYFDPPRCEDRRLFLCAAEVGDRRGELVDADQGDGRHGAGAEQSQDRRRDTGRAPGVTHAARAGVPAHDYSFPNCHAGTPARAGAYHGIRERRHPRAAERVIPKHLKVFGRTGEFLQSYVHNSTRWARWLTQVGADGLDRSPVRITSEAVCR
jgi:hypothetical protein